MSASLVQTLHSFGSIYPRRSMIKHTVLRPHTLLRTNARASQTLKFNETQARIACQNHSTLRPHFRSIRPQAAQNSQTHTPMLHHLRIATNSFLAASDSSDIEIRYIKSVENPADISRLRQRLTRILAQHTNPYRFSRHSQNLLLLPHFHPLLPRFLHDAPHWRRDASQRRCVPHTLLALTLRKNSRKGSCSAPGKGFRFLDTLPDIRYWFCTT